MEHQHHSLSVYFIYRTFFGCKFHLREWIKTNIFFRSIFFFYLVMRKFLTWMSIIYFDDGTFIVCNHNSGDDNRSKYYAAKSNIGGGGGNIWQQNDDFSVFSWDKMLQIPLTCHIYWNSIIWIVVKLVWTFH